MIDKPGNWQNLWIFHNALRNGNLEYFKQLAISSVVISDV